MRVLLFSRYGRTGASSRLRSYQYLPYLAAQGVDVVVAPLMGDDYIEALYAGRRGSVLAVVKAYIRRIRHLLPTRPFDLIWIEKEVLPWIPAPLERILLKADIPTVVDYDDAVFHRYDLHPARSVRMLLGRKIDAVMQRATAVTVGNDYLAERARRAGANRIEYLPTVVDLRRYPPLQPHGDGMAIIGWIGSPLTARYLDLVGPALAKVCESANARVVLVGSGPVKLEGVPVEVRQWSEDTEVAGVHGFDVGIMPLPDEPWERGKSGYKLIQYMACGKPVVASPVGVNSQIVRDGVEGFLATTAHEWVRALTTLLGDPRLRECMGKAGRARVEQEFCVEVTGPRLLSLFREVTRSTHT